MIDKYKYMIVFLEWFLVIGVELSTNSMTEFLQEI